MVGILYQLSAAFIMSQLFLSFRVSLYERSVVNAMRLDVENRSMCSGMVLLALASATGASRDCTHGQKCCNCGKVDSKAR